MNDQENQGYFRGSITLAILIVLVLSSVMFWIMKSDNGNHKMVVVNQNDALKADGEVVQVAADSTGTVYIDLGSSDGLRTNMTLAIYDRTATDFEKDRSKATIEVTEIIGEHLAKARVTFENPADPILVKDKILRATFNRRDRVAIALAGFFDLDDDGDSDLEELKRQIENNGGRVVAFLDDKGNIIGKIDSTTRYFVLGDAPQSDEAATAMATMKKQAKANSVDVISLRKLQEWTGIRSRTKVKRLDYRIGESGGSRTRFPRRP